MYWLSAAWHWYSAEAVSSTGAVSHPHAEIVNPIAAFVGAVTLAWAAVHQARTARRRHQEQTAADRQRRITESFSKAVEQLASEKIEARLGGIYTLERISRESRDDYWTVMETLTAFVRERVHWKEPDTAIMESVARFDKDAEEQGAQSKEPPTDVAAVLTVVERRGAASRKREEKMEWRLDLRSTDLRGADLGKVHLEGANLQGAHLEGAYLGGAHLERANLRGAHLKGAYLGGVHLRDANLTEAHLEGTNLTGALPRNNSSLGRTVTRKRGCRWGSRARRTGRR